MYRTFGQRLRSTVKRKIELNSSYFFVQNEFLCFLYFGRKDANAKAISLQSNENEFRREKRDNLNDLFLAKAENDKATADAEMKELDRQISHDRKLREFMKLKILQRTTRRRKFGHVSKTQRLTKLFLH